MFKTVSGLVILQMYACTCVPNNVCKTLEDYRTIPSNPNCWHNPDVGSGPTDIVKHYGYPVQTHEVSTEDGYVLTLYRIPHNGSDVSRRRFPVLLHHGIAVDSSSWLFNGAQSIAFVLSNNNYDVWIANSRSTKYTRHIRYNPSDPIYWNFSFHEMGIYDLPAMLDHIAYTTGRKGDIRYVGHSMGTTISYVYSSLRPDHAQNHLRSIVSLAPVAYMDHVQPVLKLSAVFRYQIWDFLTSLGLYGIGPHVQITQDLIQQLCPIYPFILLCASVMRAGLGQNQAEDKPSTFPVTFSKYPQGISLKTVMHYAQIINEKRRFQLFDYRFIKNVQLYNLARPPEYPLERIRPPVYLFYGKNDLLSNQKDVLALYEKLQTEKAIMEVFDFTHYDFLAGVHAINFYEMLLKYL